MKLTKRKYERIDALTKITGLVLVAFSVDYVFKGSFFSALFFFIAGGLISIIPLFIEVDT